TRRQSKTNPPNYYLRNIKNQTISQITFFPHPYPQLKGIEKQIIKYERKDSVKLFFELYLPPGYNKEKDGPLPTMLWAYPREYKSVDAAGQISGSPFSFIRVSPSSALVLVTQGYALLNNTSFPIIGEGDQEPNNAFIEQLVANAEAAINKAVEMGVTDRDRVAVGGHSYGAFMAANLLAHSDLFAAGIARSGAYNRTLTPFGFQAEPRTYWEAHEIYYQMSPFMHADKVKDPILLIHGIADNNSGTFPIQSERFYSALKSHGATVRLVLLPHESHSYRTRESLLHMHWEITQWLDKFVKHKK
ncbi:MAG: S9 family peptidase, partial [Bacteroidales bacterium]|nr:S9 family peptidase [Bacteroidales bacterium]